MILIQQIVNSAFSSNTYVIKEEDSDCIWLIDIGEIEGVLRALSKGKKVKGVFLTHTHYDHIYGINKIAKSFPNCIVYTSELGKDGLSSDKANLSYYHQDPITFLGTNVQILHEGDRIELFVNWFLEVLETPGHDWSCLTYKIGDYLFTGDSYIPNFEVVTKLKGGNRAVSKLSLQKIARNIQQSTIICPGHGAIVSDASKQIHW